VGQVVSVLWLAGAAAYLAISYQSVGLPDLKTGHRMFDDLIPAYEDCWDYRVGDTKRVDRSAYSDRVLGQ
jgi:hypothetical protein